MRRAGKKKNSLVVGIVVLLTKIDGRDANSWVQASILLYMSIYRYMHTFSRRPLHTLYWYLIMLAAAQIAVPMWWYVPAVVVLNHFISLFMSSKSILI